MNALRIDSQSGFLESPSPNLQTFDADKKQIVIDLAMQSAERGEWPDITALCKQVGISARAFRWHCDKDEVFRERWEEVKRAVANEIAKTMAVHSKRPGNYMDRVTLLRHLYPEEWGGERKDQLLTDFTAIKRLADALSGVSPTVIATEAEIVKPKDSSQ